MAKESTAIDPHVNTYLKDAPPGVELVSFPDLLAHSDFITLHATPTPENHHLMNAEAFGQMKPTAYLVNSGRGSLINYPALRDALDSKQIAGVALDVFDKEPPKKDDSLFTRPNVICSPHLAAWTNEGTQAIGWHAAKNLWAMISGEGTADVVIPEARTVPALRN